MYYGHLNIIFPIYVQISIEQTQNSSMSSFNIRRVSFNHQNTITEKDPNVLFKKSLTVSPNKIMFQIQQSMKSQMQIAKLTLINNSNQSVDFQIKQAKQSYFSVKLSKNKLKANQSVEIYIFFNQFDNHLNVNDEISIITRQSNFSVLRVPIFVRTSEELNKIREKIRRQSKTKQKMKHIKLKCQNNPVGDKDKRYAGIMISNKKGRNTSEKDYQYRTMHGRIEKFEEQFKNIKEFLQEKIIKCQIYRGQQEISEERLQEIKIFNVSTEVIAKQSIKNKILKRYETKKSIMGPSIRPFDYAKLTWRKDKNIPQLTYKKGLQKLLRQIRSFIIFHRFSKMKKILLIYRNLENQQSIEQPQTKIINNKFDISFSVDQSLRQFECSQGDLKYHIQVQQKKKHNYYCRKINKIISNKKQKTLGVDFALFNLSPRLLPVDFSDTQIKKSDSFETKPRIGFDNWVALQQSTVYNHQIMRYSKVEGNNKWQYHPNIYHTSNEKVRANQQTSQILPKIEKSEMQMPQNGSDTRNLMSKYKNYETSNSQLDFSRDFEEQVIKLQGNRCFYPYSSRLIQIKLARQQYQPYFKSPLQSMAEQFINEIHLPKLIHSISKQDKINFDDQLTQQKIIKAKIQDLESSENQSDNYTQNSYQFSSSSLDLNQRNQQIIKNQELAHEEILQNIKKIQKKLEDTAHGKILSFNSFIKKEANQIYY